MEQLINPDLGLTPKNLYSFIEGLFAGVCAPGPGLLQVAGLVPSPPDFEADFEYDGAPIREVLSAHVFTRGLPDAAELGQLPELARTRITLWARAYDLERQWPGTVTVGPAPVELRRLLPDGHIFKDWRVTNPGEAFAWQPRPENFGAGRSHAAGGVGAQGVHKALREEAVRTVGHDLGDPDGRNVGTHEAAEHLIPPMAVLRDISADGLRQIADWAYRRKVTAPDEAPPEELRDLLEDGHPFLVPSKAPPKP